MLKLEKDRERYVKGQVEKMGGLFYKFTSPGVRGVPDRAVIYDKQVVFVEFKRSRKFKPSPLQLKQLQAIKSQGVPAIVIYTDLEALGFVEDLKNGRYKF